MQGEVPPCHLWSLCAEVWLWGSEKTKWTRITVAIFIWGIMCEPTRWSKPRLLRHYTPPTQFLPDQNILQPPSKRPSPRASNSTDTKTRHVYKWTPHIFLYNKPLPRPSPSPVPGPPLVNYHYPLTQVRTLGVILISFYSSRPNHSFNKGIRTRVCTGVPQRDMHGRDEQDDRLSQFAWNFPDFNIQSLTSQKTSQS